MRHITCGLLSTTFLLASCQTTEDLNIQQQEILGGQLADSAEFPTVVALVDNFGGICTATLIAPRVVLTAGHCVDPAFFGPGFDEADVAAATNIVFDSEEAFDTVFGNGPGFFVGATLTVKNPAFNINALGDDDIGLVFLDQPITDRAPSPVDQDLTRNLVGTTVTQVGYGISDQNPNAGTEVVLRNKLIDSCTALGLGSNQDLVCYDQTDQSGKCDGDSGGPSFDSAGKVVGITSFGDQDCVFFGADTRTAGTSELAFLKNTVAANSAIACAADGFFFDLCPPGVDPDVPDQCSPPVSGDGFCCPGFNKKGDSDCKRLACEPAVAEAESGSLLLTVLAFIGGLVFLRRRRNS